MRCLYCHNPDTWKTGTGTAVTVEELLGQYEKNKNFYKKGGLTATGGEPLMQMEFLTELFEKAKERGIHTCLDTSGIMYRREKKEAYQRLLKSTDLVLLDLKHSKEEGHRELTRQSQKHILEFLEFLEEQQIPTVVRHVVVPGITDQKDELQGIGEIIAAHKNIKGLEVLPYHTMGVAKYESLGIPYPLRGIENLPASKANEARRIILQTVKELRSRKRL